MKEKFYVIRVLSQEKCQFVSDETGMVGAWESAWIGTKEEAEGLRRLVIMRNQNLTQGYSEISLFRIS